MEKRYEGDAWMGKGYLQADLFEILLLPLFGLERGLSRILDPML